LNNKKSTLIFSCDEIGLDDCMEKFNGWQQYSSDLQPNTVLGSVKSVTEDDCKSWLVSGSVRTPQILPPATLGTHPRVIPVEK
jgi:hypothetical protein